MSQDNDSGKKRPNPWGSTSGNNGGRKNPWGNEPKDRSRDGGRGRGGQGGGRGNDPQDFGDLLKDLQDLIADMLPGNMKGGFAGLLLLGAVIALWLASGFYIINPGEHGVIQRFGAWNRTQAAEGAGLSLACPRLKKSPRLMSTNNAL